MQHEFFYSVILVVRSEGHMFSMERRGFILSNNIVEYFILHTNNILLRGIFTM